MVEREREERERAIESETEANRQGGTGIQRE